MHRVGLAEVGHVVGDGRIERVGRRDPERGARPEPSDQSINGRRDHWMEDDTGQLNQEGVELAGKHWLLGEGGIDETLVNLACQAEEVQQHWWIVGWDSVDVVDAFAGNLPTPDLVGADI